MTRPLGSVIESGWPSRLYAVIRVVWPNAFVTVAILARFANEVRTREVFAGSIVVIEKVDMERASAAQRDDRVKLPAAAEAWMTLAAVEFIRTIWIIRKSLN